MKRHFKAKVVTAVLGVALATALTPALAMADTTGLPNEKKCLHGDKRLC